MESSPKRRVGRKVSEKHSFRFIDKINKVQEIDVYDNEKRLILVGNDSNRRLKHIINFDKCSIELRDDPVNQVINEEDVEIYLKESLNCKKTKKYLKYKAYGVFGIYQFYKLTYICLIRDIKKVATFLDSPINEIKEVDLFAIQSKKFYKKILGKKDVNIERTYKKSFRSYKIYKYFYFSYDYDLTTNIQRQRKDIALKGSKQDLFTKKFTWNGDLALFNKVFKYHEWIVPIIHGYVGTFTIDEIEGEYTLISRRSRFSTGARYLKRGINKFGHPANEVESEHIL